MFGKNEKQPDRIFYTVYDSKSQSYSEPFPAINQDVVLRDFLNAFKDAAIGKKDNTYYTNAEDFKIFSLGTFDRQTGKLIAHEPNHIANLHDLRAMAQPTGALLPT